MGFGKKELSVGMSTEAQVDLLGVNERLRDLVKKRKDVTPEYVSEALKLVGQYGEIVDPKRKEKKLEDFKHLEMELDMKVYDNWCHYLGEVNGMPIVCGEYPKGNYDYFIGEKKAEFSKDFTKYIDFVQVGETFGYICIDKKERISPSGGYNYYVFCGNKNLTTVENGYAGVKNLIEVDNEVAFAYNEKDSNFPYWHIQLGKRRLTNKGHLYITGPKKVLGKIAYSVNDGLNSDYKTKTYYGDDEVVPPSGYREVSWIGEINGEIAYEVVGEDGNKYILKGNEKILLRPGAKEPYYIIGGKITYCVSEELGADELLCLYWGDECVSPKENIREINNIVDSSGVPAYSVETDNFERHVYRGKNRITDECEFHSDSDQCDTGLKIINGTEVFSAVVPDEEGERKYFIMNGQGEQCSDFFDDIFKFEQVEGNIIRVTAKKDGLLVTRVVDISKEWEERN